MVSKEGVPLKKAENRWIRCFERQKELSVREKERFEMFRKFQVSVTFGTFGMNISSSFCHVTVHGIDGRFW